jgi:hypothetical protein
VLEKYYRHTGKAMRRCHPRDVLNHALNLMKFERLPETLSDELIDRAFKSCFLEDESVTDENANPVIAGFAESASDYWGDRVAKIPTVSGTLAFFASLRHDDGAYSDIESEREFGELETVRVLSKLHYQAFLDWIRMTLEQQGRDLTCYLSSDGNAAKISRSRDQWIERLIPTVAKAQEKELFASDLDTLLDSVLPEPEPKIELPAPVKLERIA